MSDLTRDAIQYKLITLIEEQCGLDRDEITLDADFRNDLGTDSLDDVELVMSVEEEFGIDISDEEMEKVHLVVDALDLIAGKVAKL